MRSPIVAFSLASLLSLGACSLLVPTELEVCTTKADCEAKGAAFAGSTCYRGSCVRAATTDAGAEASSDADDGAVPSGPWGCVGHVVWPLDTTGETRVSRNRIVDVSEKPVPGITLQGCGKLDPDCNKPLGAGAVTDADGIFSLTLPRGFDGFVRASAPTPLMPALVYGPPLYEDADAVKIGGEPMHAVGEGDIAALLAIVDGTVDPSTGHLFVQHQDCEGRQAAGASLSISLKGPNTKGYYYAGGLPNTDALVTDGSGLGGYVNVPPGSVAVTVRNALGQLFATRTVIVKAKTVTYLTMVPSP